MACLQENALGTGKGRGSCESPRTHAPDGCLQFEELKSELEPVAGVDSTSKGWKDVIESEV